MLPNRWALAILAGAALGAASPALWAMGSGGGGGGGMPSGGGMSQPEYDPLVEYQRGQAALEAGKYREAVSAFQHVVDATPRAGSAWLMLGEARSGAGDTRGAADAYQRAVKLDGSSIDAHRELALAYIKLKHPEKASVELTSLQTQAATCGDSCPQSADLKAAIAAIQAAMPGQAASPTAPATGSAPATPPAAANDVPPSLSLASLQAGDGAYVRAVSLINERRFPDALAALDKAELALGPHPDILTYKGYVWRRMGDWAKAEDYYRQALAIAPDHRGATEYYGELKVLEGDMAGARAMLARLDGACTFGCAEAEELRRWIDHRGDPAS